MYPCVSKLYRFRCCGLRSKTSGADSPSCTHARLVWDWSETSLLFRWPPRLATAHDPANEVLTRECCRESGSFLYEMGRRELRLEPTWTSQFRRRLYTSVPGPFFFASCHLPPTAAATTHLLVRNGERSPRERDPRRARLSGSSFEVEPGIFGRILLALDDRLSAGTLEQCDSSVLAICGRMR